MDFAQLILIAILVEAIWENIKMVYNKKKFNINMIGSLIISIIICVLARVDIFSIVKMNLAIPFIGSIFTGIIVSRGANFVNDLFNKLKGGSKDGR